MLAALVVLSCTAPAWSAPVTFTLDVPLTAGQAAAESFLQQHGGSVTGGSFSAQGWTTTTRDDFMKLGLPAGIEARRGRLSVVFAGPELSGPKGYFESYQLVALGTSQGPFTPVKTGAAGVSTLYIAYTETDEVMAQARGYFNLFDPGCSDWTLCTHEAGSSKGWLGGPGPFTVVQDWDDAVDKLAFTPGGGSKTIDLSATSPQGRIAAPQLWLTINACGGSKSNACGLWGGPTRGGPVGLTYQSVTLELIAECGDGQCSAGIEDAASCASDCVGPDGGAGAGASGGVTGSGGSGGGAGTGGGTGAASGTGGGTGAAPGGGTGGGHASPIASDTSGGCGCRAARAPRGDAWSALVLLGLGLARRRRRVAPW